VFLKDIENLKGRNIEINVVYMENFLEDKFLKNDFWLLPNIDFTLNFSSNSLDQVISRASRRRRRDIKKLQTVGYSYRISKNNNKDFDFFYWNMYLNYIKNRFGKATIPTSYTKLKRAYNKEGGIIFINKEKKPIAGLLFQIKRKTLYGKCLGFSMINQSHSSGLAGQAALFFIIRWAINEGINKLNYGNTTPFFEDGIFRYKKEWGMDISQHSNQFFCALRLNKLTEGVLVMLKENPFIFLENGVMKGFVLLDHKPKMNDLQGITSQYWVPKLDTLVVMAHYNKDKEERIEDESMITENHIHSLSMPLSTIYSGLKKNEDIVKLYILQR